MENSKLISLRANLDTIERIDKFVSTRPYYTRSYVINRILDVFTHCSNFEDFNKLAGTRFPYEKGYKFTFEVDREELLKRVNDENDF